MGQSLCKFVYSSETPVQDIEYILRLFCQMSEHILKQQEAKISSQLKLLEDKVKDAKRLEEMGMAMHDM